MSTFTKAIANENFNHQAEVIKTFKELGFNDIKIKTSFTNGVSHYVNVLDFKVINEGRLYGEMFVYDGETSIEVRISDHVSNLDTICGGVSGNRMNLESFKNLINTGAIAPLKQY